MKNVQKKDPFLAISERSDIRDSGILHHLLNIPKFESLESNPILGHSWEGYVIEQIANKLDRETQCYFYRTREGAECDLVLVRGGSPVSGIEIKYTLRA